MNTESEDKKSKKSLVITGVIAAVVLGVVIYFTWPYISIFRNADKARELITRSGAWGPVVFILMQIAQVLIAPIPGQVIGLIGGYLFGPVLGIVYTLIGATIGFTLIFILARKLGRPFVERFVKKEHLEKFDHLTEEKGAWVFFFIFLLPAFPDDIISFVAGLTTIRMRTLILISIAGRLPGYIVLSFTGNNLAYENLKPVIATAAVLLILFGIAWWKRKWLHEFVEHSNRIQFIKEHWRTSYKKIIICAIAALIIGIILYKAATFVLAN